MERLWERYEGETCLGCSLSLLGCMCRASDTLSHVVEACEGIHLWHSLCTFCRYVVKEEESSCLHHVHTENKVINYSSFPLRRVTYHSDGGRDGGQGCWGGGDAVKPRVGGVAYKGGYRSSS